jgi:integrase
MTGKPEVTLKRILNHAGQKSSSRKLDPWHAEFGNIVPSVFTPVLAKHSKSFSLIDCISVGVDRMQRNFEPMRKQVETWQRSELTDVTAKVVIYEAFVEGRLEAPKHLARSVHDPFARVSAVAGLTRNDYRLEGKRARLRLLEKGGKEQLVWLHHEAEAYLDAYIGAAGIEEGEALLFQSLDKAHKLTGEAISRRDMLRMVKERCIAVGLSETFCNHTFRGTGMTVFLSNGGSIEAAQEMANHADPRTTKLYDRRKDLAKLSEIERRIAFE